MDKRYDVFISYRREGGYDTAKHLNDLLVRDGYKVSFDIDTLRSGDFDTQLYQRIDQCKDFILIVDQNAFDRTLDKNFDPQKDWLRCELAYALKQNKNIVPIFLSGISGFPENLPDDIVNVTKKNGPEYNRYHFNAFYGDLKKRFLTSKPYNRKLFYFVVLGVLLFTIVFYFIFQNNPSPSPSSNHEQSTQTDTINVSQTDKQFYIERELDSSRYYDNSFDERGFFIKGMKNGIMYDAGKDLANNGAIYTYKCGRIIDIQVFYYQVAMLFSSTDESGATTYLDYDFGDIGYEPLSEEDSFFNEKTEYSDNQYIIGQHDMDGDGIDELIVSVRTSGDDICQKGAGISINVFKLVGGAWTRLAVLNATTNVLPANAKIINNNVYIYWLRYDELYSLINGSFLSIEYDGRAFKASDFP